MTNYKQVRFNNKRPYNQKDAQPPRQTKAQYQAAGDRWEAAGFIRVDWNKRSYSWSGNFPIFTIAPGILTDDTGTYAGLIARYGDKKILFAYGTNPAAIAARLNDEILEIIRLQDDADAPLDWQPVVDGQEIGPEVAF
jgi:hypothetical protein